MTLYFSLVKDLETVFCFLEDYEVGLDPKKTTNSAVDLLSLGSQGL